MDQTKKIILTALGMALIAFFIGGGTYAYFSDVEEVENSTFTAGTLDLEVENAMVSFDVNPLKPGDRNESFADWTLTNSGNINGILNISVGVVRNDENGRGEPEVDVDLTDAVGELGENLTVALWVSNTTKSMYLDPETTPGTLQWTEIIGTSPPTGDTGYFKLNDFSGYDTTDSSEIGILLPAGSSDTHFNIAYELPYETGNEVQSDSCSFNITFTLRQQPQ